MGTGITFHQRGCQKGSTAPNYAKLSLRYCHLPTCGWSLGWKLSASAPHFLCLEILSPPPRRENAISSELKSPTLTRHLSLTVLPNVGEVSMLTDQDVRVARSTRFDNLVQRPAGGLGRCEVSDTVSLLYKPPRRPIRASISDTYSACRASAISIQ